MGPVRAPCTSAVALFAAVLLTACASGQQRTFGGRFIKPGEPVMDYGGPPPPNAAELRLQTKKARTAAARTTPSPRPLGATIESTDQRLGAALLLELIAPTAESHLQVAQEYRRLNVLDAAYGRLNRALAKEPHLAQAHETLARVWRDWGMPQQGLGSAYRATAYDPASASAQNTLGTLFDALGRLADARQAYERAVSIDPNAAWALSNLCYVELRTGRFEQARAQCEAAVKIAPGLIAAHNNLALTFAAQGDLERARQEFQTAGDGAAVAYNLGILCLANHDYAGAAIRFEEAIKARPAFTEARERAHAARVRVLTGSE